MRTSTKLFAAGLSSLLLLAACSSGGDSADVDKPLVFAAIPADADEAIDEGFAPLIKAIEEETGRKIELQPLTSNAAVIEAQIAKRVDIAQYGAFSYYLAKGKAEIEPIAAPAPDPGAQPGALAYGVVRSDDASIQSIADLKGKNICFTDPASTTGYLQPLASLLEAGVDPESDGQQIFAGGHDTAVASLLAGDCDIAFVGDVFIDRLLPARGLLDPNDVTKVWESPLIPGPPVVLGTWLPEDLRAQIADAFTKYTAAEAAEAGLCEGAEIEGPGMWGDQEGVAACRMGPSNAWQFMKVDDSVYDTIANICELTKAEVCAEG